MVDETQVNILIGIQKSFEELSQLIGTLNTGLEFEEFNFTAVLEQIMKKVTSISNLRKDELFLKECTQITQGILTSNNSNKKLLINSLSIKFKQKQDLINKEITKFQKGY